MKVNYNPKQSSMLVLSYLSYGLFGVLGIRDFLLKKPFQALLRIVLVIVVLINTIVLSFGVLDTLSLERTVMNEFSQNTIFNRVVITSIVFITIIIWEMISSLNLLKDSYCDRHHIVKWESQKSKILLTSLTWPLILGVPFFLVKKRLLGNITIVAFVMSIAVIMLKLNFSIFYALYLVALLMMLIIMSSQVIHGDFKGDQKELENKDIPLLADSKKKLLTILLWFFFGKYGFHDFYNKKWQAGGIKFLLQVVGILSFMMIMQGDPQSVIFYKVSFAISQLITAILVFIDICYLFLNKYKNSLQQVLVFEN